MIAQLREQCRVLICERPLIGIEEEYDPDEDPTWTGEVDRSRPPDLPLPDPKTIDDLPF